MTHTKQNLLNLVMAGEPLSVVRCGDGEGIILNALSSVSALELASTAVLRRQMGYDPTLNHVKEIRENLINAINGCDVIGVPMHKQKTDSHWGKVAQMIDTHTVCTADRCDIDVAYQWLSDRSYDTLLNREVINYISCRDLDEGFRKYAQVVNKFTIAPEAKFTTYQGEPHYPTQFNRVQRWMDVVSKDWPGTLLLVGAGVIGKIYCNWWRDRGGVAVDVGAVCDLWAGFVTRGPERGLDKVDLTWKL